MKKVLIANRGEIALRIIRSLNKMGLETVAVYSTADADAPFVREAHVAHLIGEAEPSSSYLNMDRILEVAQIEHVDGIHPGYGFLSENSKFAELMSKNGIKFIGPGTKAIEIMGDKLASKQAVKEYDVPLVPGTEEAIENVKDGIAIANDIGFPVMIKASAGGGGKGMRIVKSADEFEEQFDRAVSEATSSFGNGEVFIEKFIEDPKHIEIQILADQHGNIIHLNERECSVQRRHQKIIEEAPSPVMTPELRKKMGESAINVARSCDYEGVGTVEFLVDKHHHFYFLEMNTRLQVEHPVTEYTTGLDLVEEQIFVARGEKLRWKQEDIGIEGHSIEVRVYAEDPKNNFLPDLGTLIRYSRPEGMGIRLDDGYEEGMSIPLAYDSMISKLIVHAKTRDEAIERMLKAIEDYEIYGIATTLSFARYVLQHKEFVSGKFTINFVEEFFKPEGLDVEFDPELSEPAYALFKWQKEKLIPKEVKEPLSGWKIQRKEFQ